MRLIEINLTLRCLGAAETIAQSVAAGFSREAGAHNSLA